MKKQVKGKIDQQSQTALLIDELTCYYSPKQQSESQPVLENLNLVVDKGEIVCLLGASGCGKTTLLKAIAGLLPLFNGKMTLNQTVIDDGKKWLAPEQRNIGLIFQDYALFPHLTIGQNIAFGLQDRGKSEKQIVVNEMLDLVHLSGLAERYPHQLSGGQQQRVAIARSLACQPDLLLLDEPFSNIDTQVRHELIRDIRAIFKKQGVTAIFVTHSREEAFAFSDKMAVMNAGLIEQFGTPIDLYHQPASRFVANFLGGGCYLPARKSCQDYYETALGALKIKPKAVVNEMTDEVCDVFLRPQQVGLFADGDSKIKVVEQQFMGEYFRYVLEVKGVKLLAQSSCQFVVGQRVGVNVDCESALIFPAL